MGTFLRRYTSYEDYEREKDTIPIPSVSYIVGGEVFYNPDDKLYLDVSRLDSKTLN